VSAPRADPPANTAGVTATTTGVAAGSSGEGGGSTVGVAGRAPWILYLALRRARRFVADPTGRQDRLLVLQESDDALEFARPLLLARPTRADPPEQPGTNSNGAAGPPTSLPGGAAPSCACGTRLVAPWELRDGQCVWCARGCTPEIREQAAALARQAERV